MKVLVACEWSGRVTKAFQEKGHDAYSCDIERGINPHHIQRDVLEILDWNWDLMIAFPPCTYLTNAGNTCINDPGRVEKRREALDFVRALMNAPVDKICIENPSGAISREIRKADQYIQPLWFRDPWIKKTSLWLKNLPLLEATDMCEGAINTWVSSRGTFGGVRDPKMRGITFQGIANAMADQWG